MVALLNYFLAAALAGPSAAQFFGMSPKQILALTKSLPAALITPQMTDMFNKQVNGKYGKVADTQTKVAARQEMTPRVSGAKTVKLRHGPYLVPSMMTKNGLEEGGALWNFADKQVDKPCSDCAVIGIKAGLEYEDGSDANIDTGAWLHHMVLFNVGPGRTDATCKTSGKSLPHLAIGSKPIGSERVFASGNERVPMYANLYTGDKPAAYHLKPTDQFRMLVDFMNEAMEDRKMWLTMTYDYIEGMPAEYDDIKPLWFDIDQCGFSEMQPKAQSGKFYIDAAPWTSDLEGEILGWYGHLHDGGTAVTMFLDQSPECVSKASYGGPGFQQDKPMMGQPNSATEHISNMTICSLDGSGKETMMKKGQVWKLRADYDYDQHKGMREDDGSQMEIMGIGFMYLRQPQQK